MCGTEAQLALVAVGHARELGAISSQRPDSCHSSAGCRMGMRISWAPVAFISSRTMSCTLLEHVHAQGQERVGARNPSGESCPRAAGDGSQ